MGSVVGLEFIHDVLHVEVDGRFGNGESVSDLLVAMAVADKTQDFELSRCQVFLPEVLGDYGGNVRGYIPLTSGNGANDFQKFIFRRAFEHVGGGAGA